MRFFIALEIPESSRLQIEEVQKQIKQIIPHIRLTGPEKLHLTIAFIGDQPDELKSDLTKILSKAVQEIKAFSVTPAYIDGFPNLHNARVLWIGVKGDIDRLMILRERVKDGLINLSLEADIRRYVPHITLGKVDNFSLEESQERQFEQIMAAQFEPIQINSVKLFESIPQEGFHKHNTLAEIKLD